MKHILNISKIASKMESPPKSQRLHHYFNGNGSLTDAEKVEVLDIINKSVTETCDEIKSQIKLDNE